MSIPVRSSTVIDLIERLFGGIDCIYIMTVLYTQLDIVSYGVRGALAQYQLAPTVIMETRG